jgi:hypothetical protein
MNNNIIGLITLVKAMRVKYVAQSIKIMNALQFKRTLKDETVV